MTPVNNVFNILHHRAKPIEIFDDIFFGLDPEKLGENGHFIPRADIGRVSVFLKYKDNGAKHNQQCKLRYRNVKLYSLDVDDNGKLWHSGVAVYI